VFFWRDRLFTEGILDYLRLARDGLDGPPARPATDVSEAEETARADDRHPELIQ
jgi:hypothetical protein